MSMFSKLFRKTNEDVSEKEKHSSTTDTEVIVPKSEAFNLNAMLDDVANAVTLESQGKNVTLLFEVDKNVPSKLIGDRLLLGQVIISLLKYVVLLTNEGDVGLKVERSVTDKNEISLTFRLISSAEGFNLQSDALTEARMIMEKIGASVQAESNPDVCLLSVHMSLQAQNIEEKRHYRLPSTAAMGLKVMIVDEELSAMKALQQKLEYFRHNVVAAPKNLSGPNFPDFSSLDIIFVSDKLYNSALGAHIAKSREENGLKFVLVENMFRPSKDDKEALSLADSLIFKPINQQTIYDILITFYGKESDKKVSKAETKVLPIEKEEPQQVSSAPDTDKKDQKVKKQQQVFAAKEGLERAGNDKELFSKILKKFLSEYNDSNILFNHFTEEDKFDEAQQYASELKGVLAKIGAYRFSYLLSLIEKAFAVNNRAYIEKYMAIYEVELTRTQDAIENFLVYLEQNTH